MNREPSLKTKKWLDEPCRKHLVAFCLLWLAGVGCLLLSVLQAFGRLSFNTLFFIFCSLLLLSTAIVVRSIVGCWRKLHERAEPRPAPQFSYEDTILSLPPFGSTTRYELVEEEEGSSVASADPSTFSRRHRLSMACPL